jgi:hypothetical protein
MDELTEEDGKEADKCYSTFGVVGKRKAGRSNFD